jgi:hypothetical protein
MSNERTLFADGYGASGDLPALLRERLDRTLLTIGKADLDSIGPRTAAQELIDQCTFAPIELHGDQAEIERREPHSGIPNRPNPGGIEVKLTIPFTGDGRALGRRPSEQPSEMPNGTIGDSGYSGSGYVRFEYRSPTLDAADVKAWRKEHEERLAEWVDAANKDIAEHNKTVGPTIREAISARKATLKELADFDSELGL